MQEPRLSFWQIWNMSFGFFGIWVAAMMLWVLEVDSPGATSPGA